MLREGDRHLPRRGLLRSPDDFRRVAKFDLQMIFAVWRMCVTVLLKNVSYNVINKCVLQCY